MTDALPPPLKTDAGLDELRRRTRKLSQRHRTVLLLVDGRRSRDEVLELAHKAGVAASFFDELVALGLVDAGASAAPAPADAAVAVVAETVPPAEPDPEPAPVIAATPTPAADELAAPAPEPAAETAPQAIDVTPVHVPEPTPEPPPVAPETPAPARPAPAPARAEAPRPRRGRAKGAPPPRSLPTLTEPAVAPPPPATPPAVAPAEAAEEDALIAEVRGLLIGTLLVDGPVSSSLLTLRVGRARSRSELVALVWEIERSMVRARLPREAQSRLMKARDLLALGNTQVHEDTEPGARHE
ncbi:MAG: hypothetical protein V4750_04485 [Pseudomonadota bacterium]